MISLVIIAKNAEKDLLTCINSVKCQLISINEVITVVDEETHDTTADIAKKNSNKFIIRKFDNFSSQKNAGIDLAKNDWILSLDADESLSNELANEINKLELLDPSIGYSMPRLNYFFGQPVLHTNWSPENDRHVRLFNKQKVRWYGQVHERVHGYSVVVKLNGHLNHRSYNSVEEFLNKLNTYTNTDTSTRNPFYEFARRFIWHKGFMDGDLGLYLSYLMAIYYFTIHVKKWTKSLQ